MFAEGDLDAEILAAVREAWEERRAPLLLSQLGLVSLSAPAKQFVQDNKVGLKRHIRARLADALRFVPMQREGGAFVPVNATEGLSDADLERAYRESVAATPPRPRRVRFDRDVWCAFRDPLPAGMRRAIDPATTPPAVRQIGPGDVLRPGELVLEPHETAISDDPGAEPAVMSVERAIRTWCDEKGVDPMRLAVSLVQRQTIPGQQRTAAQGRPGALAVGLGTMRSLRCCVRSRGISSPECQSQATCFFPCWNARGSVEGARADGVLGYFHGCR